MSGRYLHQPQAVAAHHCQLPGETGLPLWTNHPVGTVRECDCGLVWVVVREPAETFGGRRVVAHDKWRRESSRERRKRLGFRWWQREAR